VSVSAPADALVASVSPETIEITLQAITPEAPTPEPTTLEPR
jgi:hypothetical protein